MRSSDKQEVENNEYDILKRKYANRIRLWVFMMENKQLKLPKYRKHNLPQKL